MSQTADETILDAALDQFAHLGIRRTTTDDIARKAGVNRTTLYRRLGNKEEIVQAAILLEVQRFIERIREFVGTFDSPEERVAAGFAKTVIDMRSHPLLQRSLALEEYDTLAALTVGSADAFALGAGFIEDMINQTKDSFGLLEQATDPMLPGLLARLIHSLVLVPDAEPRLVTERELRDFASKLMHLVLG
ncbi:MAG TPA: helix-turn-helix domain-containing protein [Nocardioidaceae bacterium]|nr:helix-turn-helix domain-containing protein [Nocardioidaceae bacterium]